MYSIFINLPLTAQHSLHHKFEFAYLHSSSPSGDTLWVSPTCQEKLTSDVYLSIEDAALRAVSGSVDIESGIKPADQNGLFTKMFLQTMTVAVQALNCSVLL